MEVANARLAGFSRRVKVVAAAAVTEHEAAGGHTIALHVGKSEEFLLRAVSVDQFQSWLFSTCNYPPPFCVSVAG